MADHLPTPARKPGPGPLPIGRCVHPGRYGERCVPVPVSSLRHFAPPTCRHCRCLVPAHGPR